MSTTSHPTVCIVGAGPFGVSVAACLQFVGIDFRIFGHPMRRWLSQMPERMFLKSESCASSLYDPMGVRTLERYCGDQSIAYPEYGAPVSREVFAQYAISFQRRVVPQLEDVEVTTVSKLRAGFELRLSSGETLEADKVIVATGMDYMAYIPEQLALLPTQLRSHSADYRDLSGFKGKEVTVIGGGQSGLETAAILSEEGASVNLMVRKPALNWNSIPSTFHRSRYQRLRNPRTRLGDGLGLWVYDNFPGLFHYLPRRVRLERVSVALGPAGAWWLKDRVVGRLPILLDRRVCGAEARSGRVALHVIDQNARIQEVITDHVIAATGYRFNIQNLPFLSQSLKLQLRHEQQSPHLSSNFESSIPGLYFTGLGSANSFGPLMRFLAGTEYTARRISHHIARRRRLQIRSFAELEGCLDF